MIAIISLLVLACAVAINAQGLQSGSCVDVQFGSFNGAKIDLKRVYLTPNIADWKITIPVYEYCPYGVTGEVALICDSDMAPSAKFVAEDLLYVHRNGRLTEVAIVDITIYCQFQQPSYNKLPGSDGAPSSPKLYDQQPLSLTARPL